MKAKRIRVIMFLTKIRLGWKSLVGLEVHPRKQEKVKVVEVLKDLQMGALEHLMLLWKIMISLVGFTSVERQIDGRQNAVKELSEIYQME